MTKIKLWISDIDGTLMNYDSSYTKKMAGVIKEIQNTDVKMVLATGRMFQGAQFVADMFDINTPVVCYQGAVVRTKENILWQALVENKIVREIIEYLRSKKVHTHIYNDDILYVEDNNKEIMDEYCLGRGIEYIHISSFDEIKLNNVAKVLGVIKDKVLMQEVKDELSCKYKNILTIVQSSPVYLEINDIKASKGNALKFLKDYWNLTYDEIIASGDQDNDVDMLQEAKYRVCVGNNSKAMEKIANYHCKSVNSDELPDLIERLVLCE